MPEICCATCKSNKAMKYVMCLQKGVLGYLPCCDIGKREQKAGRLHAPARNKSSHQLPTSRLAMLQMVTAISHCKQRTLSLPATLRMQTTIIGCCCLRQRRSRPKELFHRKVQEEGQQKAKLRRLRPRRRLTAPVQNQRRRPRRSVAAPRRHRQLVAAAGRRQEMSL